jgi:hypothetical protein
VHLASGRLGWTFERKLFSRPLLGWHLTCVLSSSQTVDVNVGVRLLEAIELYQERKMELEREKKSDTESKANSYSKILPPGGTHADLFIEKVKSFITIS